MKHNVNRFTCCQHGCRSTTTRATAAKVWALVSMVLVLNELHARLSLKFENCENCTKSLCERCWCSRDLPLADCGSRAYCDRQCWCSLRLASRLRRRIDQCTGLTLVPCLRERLAANDFTEADRCRGA